jgi:hypothetical protein
MAGGFAAKTVLTWIEEWCAWNGPERPSQTAGLNQSALIGPGRADRSLTHRGIGEIAAAFGTNQK